MRKEQIKKQEPKYAKKHLGQHFLTSKAALNTIVEAAAIETGETVIEIGPGRGILTEALLRAGATVIAIEKDTELIPILKEMFGEAIASKQLTLIQGDIKDMLPESLGLIDGKFKVVANIPYYLTGLIFREILGGSVQPNTVVFLVQKEVAERIAKSKKESIASLAVKAYGTPRYMGTVKAGSFSPPPKVDSAILKIEHISRSHFQTEEAEKDFFEIIKHAFGSKRKMLAGNLSYLGKEEVSDAFTKIGIDLKVRAEDVPFPLWLRLVQTLHS
jgi:16S rRNA (adenine1518-N6/adenine1519-N6)-dimethyltransferase